MGEIKPVIIHAFKQALHETRLVMSFMEGVSSIPTIRVLEKNFLSSCGQLMPPVMGATAFLMAEFLR
jgi:hypothetical protein